MFCTWPLQILFWTETIKQYTNDILTMTKVGQTGPDKIYMIYQATAGIYLHVAWSKVTDANERAQRGEHIPAVIPTHCITVAFHLIQKCTPCPSDISLFAKYLIWKEHLVTTSSDWISSWTFQVCVQNKGRSLNCTTPFTATHQRPMCLLIGFLASTFAQPIIGLIENSIFLLLL